MCINQMFVNPLKKKQKKTGCNPLINLLESDFCLVKKCLVKEPAEENIQTAFRKRSCEMFNANVKRVSPKLPGFFFIFYNQK